MSWDSDGPGPLRELLLVYGSPDVAGGAIINQIAVWDGQSWSSMGSGVAMGDWIEVVSDLEMWNGQLTACGPRVVGTLGARPYGVAVWSGSNWQAVGGEFSGQCRSLTVFQNELVVAGTFFYRNRLGEIVRHVARWDGSDWRPIGNGFVGSGAVQVVVYNGELYVGGDFTAEFGTSTPMRTVAKWSGAGWTALGSGFAGGFVTFHIHDGRLLAGRWLVPTSDPLQSTVVEWDAEAGAWRALGNPPIIQTWALATFQGVLYAGGSNSGGVLNPATQFLRWNADAWEPVGIGVGGGSIRAMAEFGGRLAVGGFFGSAGGRPAQNFAWWDGTAWNTPRLGLSTAAEAFEVFDGELIVGGWIQAGGGPGGGVARRDAVTAEWRPLGTGLRQTPVLPGYTETLLARTGELIVGGQFSIAGDLPVKNVARWDGNSWSGVGEGLDGTPSVTGEIIRVMKLAEINGSVYAGGNFQRSGATAIRGIARFDGSQWQPLGSGLAGVPYHAYAYAMTEYRGELIVAGAFGTAGGVVANDIARWDGQMWRAIPGAPNGEGIWALLVQGDRLIVGGTFTFSDGSRSVASWDGETWRPLGQGVNLSNYGDLDVYDLATYRGSLFACGEFMGSGIVLSRNIIRWTGAEWRSVAGGVGGSEDYAITMFEHSGRLLVGGMFSTAGDGISHSWASWSGAPAGDFNGDDGVTFQDVLDFISALFAGSPQADYNGSGFSDVGDLFIYLDSYFGRCP